MFLRKPFGSKLAQTRYEDRSLPRSGRATSHKCGRTWVKFAGALTARILSNWSLRQTSGHVRQTLATRALNRPSIWKLGQGSTERGSNSTTLILRMHGQNGSGIGQIWPDVDQHSPDIFQISHRLVLCPILDKIETRPNSSKIGLCFVQARTISFFPGVGQSWLDFFQVCATQGGGTIIVLET